MPRRVEFQGKIQEFPDNATDDQIKTALSGGKVQQSPGLSFGGKALEFSKGIGKQVLGVSENVGDVASLGISAFARSRLPKDQQQAHKELLNYQNPLQKAGGTFADIAEMAIPIPGMAAVKAPATAGRLVKLGLGAAKAATEIGAKTYLQTGSPKEAALGAGIGGVTAGIGEALIPALVKVGRKIQQSTIRPLAHHMVDGFKWETLDKYKLKGDLGQSLKQVQGWLTKLRTQRDALLKPGTAQVDLDGALNDALAEVSSKAQSLKYGDMGSYAIEKVNEIRTKITGLQANLKNVDISDAENFKEFMGTRGAWAYGRGDPEAEVVELVSNVIYSKVKTAIEKSLGSAGDTVRALNKEMQDLIPVKHAMLTRFPVEERNRMFSLADLTSMLPAVMSGDVKKLGLLAMMRLQKNLRFGSALVRGAESVTPGMKAARTLGGGMRLGAPLPSEDSSETRPAWLGP